MVNAELKLDSVKAYVNNERVSGVDEDGGEIRAYKNDILEMTVKLENEMNNMTRAMMKAVIENIDDGSDIEKIHDWFDIEANNDKSKTFSFTIPDTAIYDEFDMQLEVWYKYTNGTEGKGWDIDYIVDVRKEGEAAEQEINLEGAFYNLSGICGNVITNMNNCFGYINISASYSDQLISCREDRGTYLARYNETQENLNKCISNLGTANNEKEASETKMKAMLTTQECEGITSTKVREVEKKGNNLVGIMLLLGAGFWFWDKRKKAKGTASDAGYFDQERREY